FLEARTCAILDNRRIVPPFGLEGGKAGNLGRNWVVRVDVRIEEKGATAQWQVEPGDVFVIETPGGGGFGPA
ncbi:MAG: hydantoinase B/oxoprolinase family protein, partial [Rhodospirillales bacterium]